jgi:hypothetical protein
MMLRRTCILLPGMAVALAQAKEPGPACVTTKTKVSKVLVVLVDKTAPRTPEFSRRIVAAVSRASVPGTRVVIWGFGGVHGLPSIEFDGILPLYVGEPVSATSIIKAALSPAGASDTFRACLEERERSVRSEMEAKLAAELRKLDTSLAGSSPVLYTIQLAIAAFRPDTNVPMTVLVVSDGLEHTSKGLSFYPIDGRHPTPAEAVAKASVYSYSWKGVKVSLAGLGAGPGADASTVSALTDIWSAIVRAKDGQVGEITPSVPQRLGE